MKKIVVLILVLLGFLSGAYVVYSQNIQSLTQTTTTLTPTQGKSITQSTATPQPTIGIPVRVMIDKIQIDATIEQVGLDEKNNMDVPKDWLNVGWYYLGPKPGEVGSAVFAGHLDTPTGEPSVFYNIDKLVEGDKVRVIDELGKERVFSVTDVQSYDFDQVPLQDIFANTDGKKLNLITCGGTFDQESKNYSKRVVVYTEMI